MPVRGTKPKDPRQLHRAQRSTHEWTEVLDVPFAGAPSLPTRQPSGAPWPAWTKRWWKTFSAMPHCKLWAQSHWEFAYDTAALKARFHDAGGTALAAEIRNRERVLGTTADFRRDLRIRYVTASAVDRPADVSNLDDYRDL